jgi:hypothetical protein
VTAAQEQARRWPLFQALITAIREVGGPSYNGPVTVSDRHLEIVDALLRVKETSPDSVAHYPPLETFIAGIYIAGKVRFGRVPRLLGAGITNIEKMTRYDPSPDLVPPEMRSRLDAPRALVEQALGRAAAGGGEREMWERGRWLRRLADLERARDGTSGRCRCIGPRWRPGTGRRSTVPTCSRCSRP